MAEQDEDNTWWYTLRTKKVERGLVSPVVDRVGPFHTREEAEEAPALLARRSKQWADEEQRERD